MGASCLCMCGQRADGVKPKPLPPPLNDARTIGRRDQEFEGSRPGIWDSLCQSIFKRNACEV